MNRHVVAILALLFSTAPALPQTEDLNAVFADASALMASGKPVEAEKLARRALELANRRDGLDSFASAACLNLLGQIVHVDRWDEAEALFKRALEILEKTKGMNDPRLGTVLQNLANIYSFQGRYDEAEALYKRSIEIQLKAFGPTYPGLAYPFNNLGQLYVELGRYKEAEPLLKRAIVLDSTSANAVTHLADAYRDQGQYREAERLYRRAIQTGNDHGRALTGLAVLYQRQKRFGEADAYFQQMLDLNARWGHDPSYRGEVINKRGVMYLDAQRWDRAYASFEAAARIYSEIDDLKLNEQVTARGKRVPLPYLNLPTAGWPLAQQQPEMSRRIVEKTFEAYQSAAQERTGSGLRNMALRSVGGNAALSALVRERQDFAREKVRLDKLLTSAMVEHDEKRIAELRRDKASIDEKFGAATESLKREFPAYAELSAPSPLSIAEAQGLLGDDEALLVYLAGGGDKDECFVWVVTRDAVRWERIALTGSDVRTKVRALRQGLGTEDPREAAKYGRLFDLGLAHEIYTALVAPLADALKNKRHVLVVSSSALTSLPFQLLVTEAPAIRKPDANQLQAYRDAHWFIRDHAVTVLPSVSSLKDLRVLAKGRKAPKPLVGFADPVFADANASTPSASPTRTRAYSTFWNGRSPDLDALRSLSPLPETATELRTVAKALGASPSDLHLQAAASETTVKQRDLSAYQVVYFATHGLVGGEVKGLGEPALVLSLPSKPTDLDDGLLTASEVAQLKLNADWVVLSACNTAAGETAGAEALSGLAHAFFYAGARALLVSHWQVDSESAVKLTTSTFEALKRDPTIGRAEALRRSMLAMIDDKSDKWNAYPDYWSPFSIIGEGELH